MLYDYCCDYIENNNSFLDPNCNQKIYNMCCDYILGVGVDTNREALIEFFNLKIK